MNKNLKNTYHIGVICVFLCIKNGIVSYAV